MSRSLFLVAAAVLVLPASIRADAPQYVQIIGVVGGSQLNVKAANVGGKFVGIGTLTAPTGQTYNLKVISGMIVQGHYVSLQGVILAPNGTPVTSFVLNGDRDTGGITFMYMAGGNSIRQDTIGSVVFFP